MKPIKIVVYLVLALLAIALWCYTHSDRAKIVRLFESAAKIATKEPTEHVMESAVKARALAAYFGDTCRFKVPELHCNVAISNADLSGAILSFRQDANKLCVKFDELDVFVEPPAAHVEGVVELSGTEGRLMIDVADRRNFSADLEKGEDGWKITAITLPRIK